MKIQLFILSIVASTTILHAQEDDLEAKGRSILSDPRLNNLFRSVEADPAAAVSSIQSDPDDAVRAATQIFNENRSKVSTSDIQKLDTPENRAKAQNAAAEAVSTVSKMIPQALPTEPDLPAAPVVPATRPAPINPDTATVAMPTRTVASEAEPVPMPETVMQENTVKTIAGAAATTPRIPDTPSLTPDSIPDPEPLTPRYNTTQQGQLQGADSKHMQITAKESIMDNESGLLTFTGNVFVDHPIYDITCERLEIYMAEGGAMSGDSTGESSFKKAIASGGMVRITQLAVDDNGKPKTRVALGRRAEFDAITKDMVLSGGPPQIQDGGSFVETNSPDAQIIMRGNGKFEVVGSDNGEKGRTRIVIPIPGGDQTQDLGLGGAFGGGLSR